ncbi:hypothetical protein, partial [Xanthomonas euvesicatoria]|uniref:hypothetical protein n=1 Tax=Xanthomonas euvesicatoria TaxID=456327 RepID=UPI001C465B22
MNPATIITGALLSQVLLAVIMFVAASILHAHLPRHGRLRGEPVRAQYTWLILGFYPVFTDTYKKADQGHEECSCQSA